MTSHLQKSCLTGRRRCVDTYETVSGSRKDIGIRLGTARRRILHWVSAHAIPATDMIETKGNSPFQAFLDKTSPKRWAMPIFHTTDAFSFRNMVERRAILPSECPVFKEEHLVYFFYGRPSYRKNSSFAPSLSLASFPVSLVFDDCDINFHRVSHLTAGHLHRALSPIIFILQCRSIVLRWPTISQGLMD